MGFQIASNCFEIVEALQNRALHFHTLLLFLVDLVLEELNLILEQVKKPDGVVHLAVTLDQAEFYVGQVELLGRLWAQVDPLSLHRVEVEFLRGRCLGLLLRLSAPG